MNEDKIEGADAPDGLNGLNGLELLTEDTDTGAQAPSAPPAILAVVPTPAQGAALPGLIAELIHDFSQQHQNSHTASEYGRLCRRFFGRCGTLDWKDIPATSAKIIETFVGSHDARERSSFKRFVQTGLLDRLGYSALRADENFKVTPNQAPRAASAPRAEGDSTMPEPSRSAASTSKKISAWATGGERVRFFRPGTGELAGHPRVTVGLPSYGDADLRGATDPTEFVQRYIVPQFGPFAGEEAVVYLAEIIDKNNKVVGEIPIPVQPARRVRTNYNPFTEGRGEASRFDGLNTERDPAQLSPLEQEALKRSREDGEVARRLQEQENARTQRELRDLAARLERSEAARMEAEARANAPPVIDPIAMRREAEREQEQKMERDSTTNRALGMSERLAEKLLNERNEMRQSNGGMDIRAVADMVQQMLKPVIEMVTRQALPSSAPAVDLAMVERLHKQDMALLELRLKQEAQAALAASKPQKSDFDEQADHIEKLVNLGKKLSGNDQQAGPSSPGVEIAQAIGNTLEGIANSPVAQAIARNAAAAQMRATQANTVRPPDSEFIPREWHEIQAEKKMLAQQKQKPMAIPTAVAHALKGLAEATDDTDFEGALQALVQGLMMAGGKWAEKANAIAAEFQKIETYEELQILLSDVIRGLNSTHLLKQYPGFLNRAAEAIGRKFSGIHELLAGAPKELIGVPGFAAGEGEEEGEEDGEEIEEEDEDFDGDEDDDDEEIDAAPAQPAAPSFAGPASIVSPEITEKARLEAEAAAAGLNPHEVAPILISDGTKVPVVIPKNGAAAPKQKKLTKASKQKSA